VIGGTSVAGGRANVPGLWGAALFLVLLLTMLNTLGVSAGVRLVLTGLMIVAVITAAGSGNRAPRGPGTKEGRVGRRLRGEPSGSNNRRMMPKTQT
jgi:hypothetical protein